LHKAKELPKEGLKTEVERHDKEAKPWKIFYFELCWGATNPVATAWR
jgi:hypothetical protein